MPIDLIDHTADLRIRVTERDKKLLYLRVGNALIDLIYDHPQVSCEISYEFQFKDKDAITYLNNLLYEIERLELVIRIKCITFQSGKIKILACGERFDAKKHRYHYLIKAATYHRFLEASNYVEVTFDI